MKIGEFDALTGEQIVRDATPEELQARKAEIAEASAQKAEKKKLAEELRITKIAAYQKLGLTDEEINAILPQ